MSLLNTGEHDTIYLIDMYGLIYRSYFGFIHRPLMNDRHENISAVFGVSRAIVQLLDSGLPGSDGTFYRPRLLAGIFDSRTPTFRHEAYPLYKSTRTKAPEPLHAQVPQIEYFMDALKVRSFRADGFEADDIIATLAMRARAEGRPVYIISEDKDLLQMVGDGIYVIRRSKSDSTVYDKIGPEDVRKEWGIMPSQIRDFLALAGDSSDDVPGVHGIGEKTATQLLGRYQSIEGVYRNIAAVTGSVAKKLANDKESMELSRKLVTLCDSVPLDVPDFEILSVEQCDRHAGAIALLEIGVHKPAKDLDPDARLPAKTGEESPLSGPGTYKVILDAAVLEQVLEKGRNKRCLAIDFETDSLDSWHAHPVGISLAIEPKKAFYVPVVAHAGTAPFVDPEQVKALLLPIFADPDMTCVLHNAKYDYAVARVWGIPRWQCRIFDTMIAAWVVDPERSSYALDSLAAFFFDHRGLPFNEVVPKGQTFDVVPLDRAVRYSAEDADLCIRLKELLEPQFGESAKLFYELEMPLVPILAEMEGVGIRIDTDFLRNYGQELAAELSTVEAEIFETVGHEFNIASSKQLQDVLFVERNLKATRRIQTGYSTDSDILEELAKTDPVPALVLRHRTLSKLKSTYIDALIPAIDSDSRLHTSFMQTGTATGRLSSREPNLQNIPVRDADGRKIREAFVAQPGTLLIAADYSQIELVVLAHLSGDKVLSEAFRNGKDIHTRTAASIFHIDESAVSADQRRIAKTINFGVVYGMGATKLSNTLRIHRSEAVEFIRVYFEIYSGVWDFIEATIKTTEEFGYVTTLFGRKRQIFGITSVNDIEKSSADRVAVNTIIQGSAADIVKKAMIDLDAALRRNHSNAQLLLQVHDELIVESPESEFESDAELVRHIMEHTVSLDVPLCASVKIAQKWI
ncbi:DNA polymerase [Spirochaetia bacterium]|nr:DNA polymerase [Spirochaetia bacterium]